MPAARTAIPHRAVLPFVLALLAAAASGCLASPGDGAPPAETGTQEAPQNLTIPDPVIVRGETLVGHPLHSAGCIMNGVDGAMHELGQKVDDWRFRLSPDDTFVAYWWQGEDYLDDGSGESAGTVPAGATHVEVCRTTGTETAEYVLTIRHPDDPEA